MWFKNLLIYRLNESFEFDTEQLHEKLEQHPARPCGGLESETLGWDRPLGRHGSRLTHAVGPCIMVCARREQRLLPAAVIRQELEERVAQVEDAEQRTLRRREREEIKEAVRTELLPKAFCRSTHTYAYIDTKGGWLLVDSSSAKVAEELISLLRESLDGLKLKPLQVQQAPASVMTRWLSGAAPTDDFLLGEACELRDPSEQGAVVRCRNQDLGGEEIQAHLKAGKQLVRVAVEWHERIAFNLCDDLVLRQIKFLDQVLEEAAESEAEDPASRFDTDFALMSLELQRLLPRVIDLFGGLEE